ncbi:MAG: aminotransferase class IV [Lewinella sp.]
MLESIRIKNGRADLLPYHQRRVDRSRRALFGKPPALNLEKVLSGIDLPASGLYKLRIEYGAELLKKELIPYTSHTVNSLKLVEAEDFTYGKKFVDRSNIRKCLEKKGHCDDVLMVQKGHLTDASYANIALFDGRHWYTPAWPLLRGTRREQLLDLGVIRPIVIRVRDLDNFGKLRLMNAMLPWEEAPTLDCGAIIR